MILLKGSLVIRAQLWDFKNLTGEGGCGGGEVWGPGPQKLGKITIV